MRSLKLRLTGVIVAAALLLAALPAEAQPGHGGYKSGELVLKLESGYSIDSINALFGTSVKSQQPQTGVYLLTIPEGQDPEALAEAIRSTPGVQYCGPNFYLSSPEGLQRSSAFVEIQVRMDPDSQWASRCMSLVAARDIATGLGIQVAVIDGGVNLTHAALLSGNGDLVSVWDYVDNDSVANDEPGGANSGHGTFIAGVTRLVAPDVDIYCYRVLDTTGVGDGYTIAEAVLRAIDDGCDVIGLSLGMVGVHDALDDALKLARQHDITIVAAAGNDSTDATDTFPFPASRSYCLTVAALDSTYKKAEFSNYGVKIDICAPGVEILSPFLDSSYAWWDGTSFSVPFVGGLAALARSLNLPLTSEEVDSAILTTAINVDSLNPGLEGLLGVGLPDPVAALRSLLPARGDVTGDGAITVEDLSLLARYLALAVDAAPPGNSGDVNCDGSVDIADVSDLVDYLFFSGIPPCSLP